MKYIDFYNKFKSYTIISLEDIRIIESDFDINRITQWIKRGLIKRIKSGFYIFADLKVDEKILMNISNKIYEPSYISLESALRYYNLIPEGVFIITSISTKKTNTLRSEVGTFLYKSIKPQLFFGYDLVNNNNFKIKIANKEKLILDYLYFNHNIDEKSLFELRINKEELVKDWDEDKFNKYSELFNSQKLNKRIKYFKQFLNND